MMSKKIEASKKKRSPASQSQSTDANSRRSFLGRAGVIAGGMLALSHRMTS